ncbi:DNA polymerase delta subunit 2 [Microplitis demolitor]|uniref:DNA polymerase delta subunit 2 n=1 Tax=Microplitis demolitor TaxID=69319 RepID=UPI0004CD19A0|nr:DNA polymerase delta subunit 2 [Microplitis demolitor]
MVQNYETCSSDDKNSEPKIFKRKTVDYQDFGSKFLQKTKDYAKQFFHVYSSRLRELRIILEDKASKKWPEAKILKLPELENLEDEKCVIIGTLFKHQVWKPSILRELSDEIEDSGVIPEKRAHYASEKDQLYLEDEMLRIKIVGDVDFSEVVTGVVCALMGKTLEDGSFKIDDWCFPGCPPRQQLGAPVTGKLLLVSGLDLANDTNNLARDLLLEWISGMAGSSEAQEEAASIINLVIAGNSVKTTDSEQQHSRGLIKSKALEMASTRELSAGINKLDKLLSQILNHCSVTLMPGQYDPSNVMLPQKPIHRLLLRESRGFENLKGVNNPWSGVIGNRLICGSSGQPIEDIIRVCGESDRTALHYLEKTLDWRHFCPTAPDTLPSYPFHDKDLFIMQQCPDIYFAGNTEKFETKIWKNQDNEPVRLICVPKFSTTSTAVLVDLKTLDVTPISFGIN